MFLEGASAASRNLLRDGPLHGLMSRSVDIIPIELDALPVPVRVLKESQKSYMTLLQYEQQLVNVYNQTGEMPRDFFRVQKLKLDLLKFIKEMTLDTQATFEQQAATLLVEIAREDPDLRKKLGAEAARRYFQSRQVIDVEVSSNDANGREDQQA